MQPNFSNIYNIEYQLYSKLIGYINQNIDEYKKLLVSNKEYFENIIGKANKNIIEISNSSDYKNSLITIFKKLGQTIKNNFFDYYNIKDFKLIDENEKQSKKSSNNTFSNDSKYKYTDEEIYSYTNTIDFNRTLFNSFYENLLNLITSNQIEQFLDVKNKNIDDLKQQPLKHVKNLYSPKNILNLMN